MLNEEQIPHILKYMGGKRDILTDIGRAVNEMDEEGGITDFCDLFSGTTIVSYAFSDHYNVVSNDIQCYSAIFANTYASDFSQIVNPGEVAECILRDCAQIVEDNKVHYPNLDFPYQWEMDFQTMKSYEELQMNLRTKEFDAGFSFFKQNYSGTYWSYEQCLWIDAIRAVAERYRGASLFYPIMSALIFSMSYASQSTGHFAQYRTLTSKNYKSVLLYRMKEIPVLFQRKLIELITVLNRPRDHSFRVSTLDYSDCIATLSPNTIVYADPPYSAVHYSRFYHVLETLVRYDHPRLEYKARYRDDRYQSPFDQARCVEDAFRRLFVAVRNQRCHLLLSYSDNAMLSEERITEIASQCLGDEYHMKRYSRDYQHMTMGRSDQSKMDVHELLLAFKHN